jgi:hypothetical protein
MSIFRLLGSRKNKLVILGVESLTRQSVKSLEYRDIPGLLHRQTDGMRRRPKRSVYFRRVLSGPTCKYGISLFLNVDPQPVLCLFKAFMNVSISNPVTGWPGSSRHLHEAVNRCGPFDFFPDPPAAGVFPGDNLRPPPIIYASSINDRQSP